MSFTWRSLWARIRCAVNPRTAWLPPTALFYFLALFLQGFTLRLGRYAAGIMGNVQHFLAVRYALMVYLLTCVAYTLVGIDRTSSRIEEAEAQDTLPSTDVGPASGPGPDILSFHGWPGTGSELAYYGDCECFPDIDANINMWRTNMLIAIVSAQFVSSRGNEYFCEIDEDYLTDRFNLTGLNTEVSYYQYALDLVTDVFDLDADDDLREQIEKSARHLYGLVHARYIVTTRGLAKMVRELQQGWGGIEY
jgi:hypothetical protein